MRRLFCTVFGLLLSGVSYAANQPMMQCGEYIISSNHEGVVYINNQRPETQEFAFLGKKDDYANVKYHWMLPDVNQGRWLKFDYMERNGEASLNVETTGADKAQSGDSVTYDCRRVQ